MEVYTKTEPRYVMIMAMTEAEAGHLNSGLKKATDGVAMEPEELQTLNVIRGAITKRFAGCGAGCNSLGG